jgi:hypothetical protein
MAKQRNIGLTQNGLLTEEAVRCYMEGSLSEEQRKEFEAILANDPFAQDAIEGMKASASVSQGFSSVEEIKTNIRNRTGLAKGKYKSTSGTLVCFCICSGLGGPCGGCWCNFYVLSTTT